MALTNGTDAGNAIGDYIEMGPTASWAEDLYDGLTQTLNTDGTLQSSIVTTAKINDGAVTTAKLASGAVTSSTLAESAVTASKLDNSSFPTSVVEVGSNSTVVTGATFVSTTFAFVNGSTYLITGKTQQSSSSDGGVWVNTLEVNGVSIDTARYGGTLGTQMPAAMIKVYVAAATASYTVSMVASRVSGSGTASVEIPTIQIVPLLH